jgi:hypothetical protein
MAFQLEILQIVVMAGEVQTDFVPPQQGVAVRDQLWVIAMLSIVVQG